MKKSMPIVCVAFALVWATSGAAQVVQLPSVGTFSISTSVAVPDRGNMAVGGLGTASSGRLQRGPGIGPYAAGGTRGGTHASLHTTVIDLDELDRMIRSQTGKYPSTPELASTDPNPHVRIPTKPRGRIARPEYDYLMALSGHGQVVQHQDMDAVRYYLTLAEHARLKGNWAAVKLYYEQAWNHLPEKRRVAVLEALSQARTQSIPVAQRESLPAEPRR
jgi:hypothetical protein